jgi:hypothetical protein
MGDDDFVLSGDHSGLLGGGEVLLVLFPDFLGNFIFGRTFVVRHHRILFIKVGELLVTIDLNALDESAELLDLAIELAMNVLGIHRIVGLELTERNVGGDKRSLITHGRLSLELSLVAHGHLSLELSLVAHRRLSLELVLLSTAGDLRLSYEYEGEASTFK